MAQAVSRRPLTAEVRVRAQVGSLCDLCWTDWHWDRIFSEFLSIPLSTAALHTYVSVGGEQ